MWGTCRSSQASARRGRAFLDRNVASRKPDRATIPPYPVSVAPKDGPAASSIGRRSRLSSLLLASHPQPSPAIASVPADAPIESIAMSRIQPTGRLSASSTDSLVSSASSSVGSHGSVRSRSRRRSIRPPKLRRDQEDGNQASGPAPAASPLITSGLVSGDGLMLFITCFASLGVFLFGFDQGLMVRNFGFVSDRLRIQD